MATASLDPEKIRESFPNPTIPKITGTPNYFSIAEAHMPLNANSASVYSARGNGALGHYILTATATEYLRQAGVNFIRPSNPGVHPIVPTGSTDPQIQYIKREHEERIREYRLFNATDAALKLQLIKAVDETYIRGIRDRITGYATRTTRDIIEYLYRTYGSVTPAQLIQNDQNFKTPYDGSTDLETYFNGLEDCLHMAEAAGQPYSEGQTLTTATGTISQSQRFPLAIREWHRLDLPSRTWAAFKTTLLAEQKSERDNGFAPTSTYANNANGNQETAEALNHLAQATAADRQASANQAEAVANLTMSNQNLAQQLQQAQTQLQQMLAQFQTLSTTVQAINPTTPTYTRTTSAPVQRNHSQKATTGPRGNQPPRSTRRW